MRKAKLFFAAMLLSIFTLGMGSQFVQPKEADLGLWAAKKISENEYVHAGAEIGVGYVGARVGAWAGAKVGALVGAAGGPVGAFLGGLVGAIGGGL